ncbi:hypothetical protein CCR75_009673 [Bremia lactucae]|uniref:Uncharacterized protein n=1 Tax=Bremia lactucae TaxID=4779 RepID=A0A976II39_BRELC|nr:hypothetical protein CCR75_009673 [Bremia lactucae]
MDLFNKAKETLKNGGNSSKSGGIKDIDVVLGKVFNVMDKYQVKEKAAEFAQKQISKREDQPRHVGKKDKSIIVKAKEAAEDFLAKQGNKPVASRPVQSNGTNYGPSQSYPVPTSTYESYQEYWSRHGSSNNGPSMPTHYSEAIPYAIPINHQPSSASCHPPYV